MNAAIAIAVGTDSSYESAKATLRESGDAEPLWRVASEAAERAGLSVPLSNAVKAVGFATPNRG